MEDLILIVIVTALAYLAIGAFFAWAVIRSGGGPKPTWLEVLKTVLIWPRFLAWG